MNLPVDYAERVYAGVLGKIIGVYLGRPFEGWWYDRIMRELGEIWYYVHDRRGVPLIVTDDDISGTFTFVRALQDYDPKTLTPAQIGQTWMNYIIEKRAILWWGGMGMSTEHTAFLRMKHGIQPPLSGAIATNGKVVAEQIGAQIFIDGWAMAAPGDPELAADLARRAASVSHDGEAIYGAQVIAAMEAQAFVEADINKLIDCGVSFIPKDSIIYRMIEDIREWHAEYPDWRQTREQIAANYGYDKYGGNCHMVPNHGLIIFSLLYGNNDFQKSLMIVNTSGWDTDCNSANVGCLLGIKNGLAGIDAGPDWRGPVADRLYLATADGGRAVSDAVTETYHLVNSGRALQGLGPVKPKNGARFHFDLPGAVQGFMPDGDCVRVENVAGHSESGARALAIHYQHVAMGRPGRVQTATFITPEAAAMPHYGLIASPTLYQGQTVRARLSADADNLNPAHVRLYVAVYGAGDQITRVYSPPAALQPGASQTLAWTVRDIDGAPIVFAGLEIMSDQRTDGTLYLDYLTWDGTPDLTFTKPAHDGTMWRRQWVDGVDHFIPWGEDNFRLAHNEGTGLIITGTREWTDYDVSATVTPHMVKSGGIAARVQGMKRYYGLLLCDDGMARLVKGDSATLAETKFPWSFGESHALRLRVSGSRVQAWINDHPTFDVTDTDSPYTGGGVAYVVEEGRMASQAMTVKD